MIATETQQAAVKVKATVTRLIDYATCPAYYQRRHLLKLPGYVTPAMQAGRDVHALAQDFLEGKPLGPVDQDLNDAFEALKFALQDPTGVEQALFREWDDGDLHVLFEGRLDWYQLQGDVVRIIDLKSGFGIIGVKDLSVDLQAQAYAWLAFGEYPWVTRVRFEQAQLRYHGRMLGTEFARDQSEGFFESVLRPRVRQMATDTEFRPNPMCDRCPPGAHLTALDPYRQVQVQVKDGGHFDVSFDPIISDEAFKSAAFGWLLAGRIGAALKSRMDEYTDAQGPKPVTDDEMYGPWLQPERVCSDIEQAIEFIRARFPDEWKKYVRLDLAACKGLLGDGRRAMPELQALMVEVPATRHGLRKVRIPLSIASASNGVEGAFPPSAPAFPPEPPAPTANQMPAVSSTTDEAGPSVARSMPPEPPPIPASPLDTQFQDSRNRDRISQPETQSPNAQRDPSRGRVLAKGVEVPIAETGAAAQAGVAFSTPALSSDWSTASVVLRLRQAAARSTARSSRRYLPALAGVYADRWALIKAIFPEATILADLSPKQAQALVEWSQAAEFDRESALIEASL